MRGSHQRDELARQHAALMGIHVHANEREAFGEALGLPDEPIPLWWTGDFILASPEGTPSAEEKWIIGEFNCSCVGAPFPRDQSFAFQAL